MCGICGIVSSRASEEFTEVINRMVSTLQHRGPDDEGYYHNQNVALGHRRLSIIDLSTGHQPMSNEDKSVWIVLNGEIYNFQTLYKELKSLGHKFSTNSDTEAVIHCYEQYGEECVKHLRGMFAFAIWDEHNKKLMLARDRLGKKPLFYTEKNGRLIFASEIQALLQEPSISREIDYQRIDEYLTYGYIPAPYTIFKEIKKIQPASYLTLQKGRINIERYWDLNYTPKLQISEDEASERLLDLLKESVKLRMISDVPLGAFLSGGIDSSAIVALMSQLSGDPVKTFSIGFENAAYNELGYAKMIAQRYNTDHHEFIIRPDALNVIPMLARHYGEPYADSSAIPSFYVSLETRRYVSVALNGDGGDENFAGYERYFANQIASYYQKIPAIVRNSMEKCFLSIPAIPDLRSNIERIKRFLRSAGLPIAERHLAWLELFSLNQKMELYSQEFLASADFSATYQWFRQLFFNSNGLDLLDSAIHVDTHSYLPYDLLVKVDITSMANSLELRSPFLDHHFMEFSAQLPSRYKLKGKIHKYILKKAMDGILPDEILHRKKKGFGVPLDSWFRNDLKPMLYDVILSPQAIHRGYFKPEALQRIIHEHITKQQAHGQRLWALLMLEMWHREFTG